MFRLGHLHFAEELAAAGSVPGQEPHCCTPSPRGWCAHGYPKRRWGIGRDISNLAPKVALSTSLLWGLDNTLERISVSAASALPSLLASPATAATSPSLPPELGEPPGLGRAWGDREVCWLVRAAGVQPGHAFALLTTQSHTRCLAAQWEHLGPFPGQIVGWLGRVWLAKSLSGS